LKKLGELKNLQALDVFDCPLTEGESYREEIFAAIPSLKYLDGFNVVSHHSLCKLSTLHLNTP
jgi:hypothetical protein